MHWIKDTYTSDRLEALKQRGAEREAKLIDAFKANPSGVKLTDYHTEFKEDLMACHHGNCAYCEAPVENQPGDVEHYRPKGAVKIGDNERVKIVHPTHGEMDHPGYFWKAYSWDNLLLACRHCNSDHKHSTETGQQKFGKLDRFELMDNSVRAIDPDDDLTLEQPKLVNPRAEDPTKHLVLETVLYRAVTEVGRYTIALLGLNERANLVTARKKAFRAAKQAMLSFSGDLIYLEDGRKVNQQMFDKAVLLGAIIDGSAPFLTAHRRGLLEALAIMDEVMFKEKDGVNVRHMVSYTIERGREAGYV
ncbi:MAG: hypothetical protein AAGL96_14825 [Pseudomonadota bacterium]